MKLTLPWPPSVNHYWLLVSRGRRPAMVIGKKGREFRANVEEVVGKAREQGEIPSESLTERLRATIRVYCPDKRRRDMDNVLKATLDALEHAGLFEDDAQIDELHVYRDKEIIKGGKLEVTIEILE